MNPLCLKARRLWAAVGMGRLHAQKPFLGVKSRWWWDCQGHLWCIFRLIQTRASLLAPFMMVSDTCSSSYCWAAKDQVLEEMAVLLLLLSLLSVKLCSDLALYRLNVALLGCFLASCFPSTETRVLLYTCCVSELLKS